MAIYLRLDDWIIFYSFSISCYLKSKKRFLDCKNLGGWHKLSKLSHSLKGGMSSYLSQGILRLSKYIEPDLNWKAALKLLILHYTNGSYKITALI